MTDLSPLLAEARRIAEEGKATYLPELHIGDDGYGCWVMPPEGRLAALALALIPVVEALVKIRNVQDPEQHCDQGMISIADSVLAKLPATLSKALKP